MNKVIDVICPQCKKSLQAPLIYKGKEILCVHCKFRFTVVEAMPDKEQVTNTTKSSTDGVTSTDNLWSKLNGFRFKDLTKQEMFICLGVICFLLVCFIIAPSNKSEQKSSRKGTSNSSRALRPSIYPVERFIKENAKDPSSIEIIDYSEPKKVKEGIYKIRVKYRGKNGFGGYSVEDKIFYLKQGDGFWNVVPY